MSQKKKQPSRREGSGTAVLEREAIVAPPPLYSVWLLNDDYTPMEFVVQVLTDFFYKKMDEAEAIMLKVHHEGKAVCGAYPRDLAETKVMRVMKHARAHGHPLQCVMDV